MKKQKGISRREFVASGLTVGGAFYLLPAFGLTLPSFDARAQTQPGSEHFYLQMLVPTPGGIDSSYLFDARPLEMTKAGIIQNYLEQEPTIWMGNNGFSTLATSLVKPLEPYRNAFSVINGILMTPSFDGHDQNLNYLLAGDPFGGESFIPHLNLADAHPRPLDALQRGNFFASLTNSNKTVPLGPVQANSLIAALKNVPPLDPNLSLYGFLRQRLVANSLGADSFSGGAREMTEAFDGIADLAKLILQIEVGAQDDVLTFISMMGQMFKLGITKSAYLILTQDNFDTHAANDAKKQPDLYVKLINQIVQVLKALRETPFDGKRSLMDVTTFSFTSEFGRTMRQPGLPVDGTGTNHNPLSNFMLIGGKGIRGGQVIGASDLVSANEKPSQAHLSLDPQLLKTLSRPFNFDTMTPTHDTPEQFNMDDYLGIGSVVNTIYSMFGVQSGHWRLTQRNGKLAPVLKGLIS